MPPHKDPKISSMHASWALTCFGSFLLSSKLYLMPLYILTLRHIRYYCILKRSILSLRTTLKFFSLVPFFFSSFYLIFIGVWILTHEVVSNSLSYTANSCGFSLCVTIHKHTCIFLPLTQLCILQLTIVFFFSKLISTMPFCKGSLVNSLYI